MLPVNIKCKWIDKFIVTSVYERIASYILLFFFRYPGDMTTEKKLMGHCIPECVDYGFDHSFWVSTMITEWDLVCEKSWLKTLAKLLLFTGSFLLKVNLRWPSVCLLDLLTNCAQSLSCKCGIFKLSLVCFFQF